MKLRIIGLAAGALSIGLLAAPAHAITTFGGLTAGTFCANFDCNAPVASLTSSGDFEPFDAVDDTTNFSFVFAGTGANAGIYAYVYRIIHLATSSEAVITGMTIEYSSFVTALGLDAFYITDSLGTVAPSGIFDVLNTRIQFDFRSPALAAGSESRYFGFFSTDPNRIIQCNQLDTGDEATPACLAPGAVPEPGSLLLLAAGLLGLGGAMRVADLAERADRATRRGG